MTKNRLRGAAEFTLIECVPRKAHDFLLDASSNPANFPIQAGSLTRAPHLVRGGEGGVTKSRDGKLAWHGVFNLKRSGVMETGAAVRRTPKPGHIEGLLASRSGKANMRVAG